MNLEKTKFMIFSFKKQNFEFDLKINGNRLEKVTKFDHLGIVLHENLKWDAHVDKITSKVRRTLAVMRKICKITPKNILKMIYMSLIHSQFNYGILLWGFEADKLFNLQKKAIRMIIIAFILSIQPPYFMALIY